MKKYLLSFIMVFLLTLTTSVYAANTCDTYGTQSCPERDDYKNYCMIGSNGQCTYKKKYVKCTEPGDAGCDCSTFGQSDCTKMFNSDGKACDIVNGVCTVAASGSSRDIEYNQPDNPTPDQPTDGYDNYEADGDVVCGKGWVFNRSIANVTHYMVLLFQIIAPVMLIILGMIDLLKGIVAGKDDDIKKGQSVFIKRLIIAILLFSVITIVRIVLNLLSNGAIIDCFDCFVNGAKNCTQSM